MNKPNYAKEQHSWPGLKAKYGKWRGFPEDAPMVTIPRPIAIRALILAQNVTYSDATDAGVTSNDLIEMEIYLNNALGASNDTGTD